MANGQATPQLFEELEELRMARDWTYSQLAANIASVTRRHRDEDCWRRICQGLTPHPHGRTLDILQEFLVTIRGRRPRRKPAARRAL